MRFWRRRWARGAWSLDDKPGRGRKPGLSPFEPATVQATACEVVSQTRQPLSRQATADITRRVNDAIERPIRPRSVWRILRRDAIQPWRYGSWIFPREAHCGPQAAAFGLATLGAFVCLPYRRRPLLGYLAVWLALVIWWNTLAPSHDRDWQLDVAVLPYATVDGDRVTLHNIRHFAYRTDTDFTPQYYDKTVDLTQLASVDLVSSYWGSAAIAHLFVSFGFGGQDYVAVSLRPVRSAPSAMRLWQDCSSSTS